MSGVKRVNAAPHAADDRAPSPPYWRAKRAKGGLPVQSRYRDARCFMRGGVLLVKSAALQGTIQLPARIDTKARALNLLAVEEKYEDGGFVLQLTHPVLKFILGPWLTRQDMARLSKATSDLPHSITQSVQGIARHECDVMNRHCACPGFKCPLHYTWQDCRCMDGRRMSRDAEAVFYAEDGELRIGSASFPELWINVTLPLRYESCDGVLVLRTAV